MDELTFVKRKRRARTAVDPCLGHYEEEEPVDAQPQAPPSFVQVPESQAPSLYAPQSNPSRVNTLTQPKSKDLLMPARSLPIPQLSDIKSRSRQSSFKALAEPTIAVLEADESEYTPGSQASSENDELCSSQPQNVVTVDAFLRSKPRTQKYGRRRNPKTNYVSFGNLPPSAEAAYNGDGTASVPKTKRKAQASGTTKRRRIIDDSDEENETPSKTLPRRRSTVPLRPRLARAIKPLKHESPSQLPPFTPCTPVPHAQLEFLSPSSQQLSSLKSSFISQKTQKWTLVDPKTQRSAWPTPSFNKTDVLEPKASGSSMNRKPMRHWMQDPLNAIASTSKVMSTPMMKTPGPVQGRGKANTTPRAPHTGLLDFVPFSEVHKSRRTLVNSERQPTRTPLSERVEMAADPSSSYTRTPALDFVPFHSVPRSSSPLQTPAGKLSFVELPKGTPFVAEKRNEETMHAEEAAQDDLPVDAQESWNDSDPGVVFDGNDHVDAYTICDPIPDSSINDKGAQDGPPTSALLPHMLQIQTLLSATEFSTIPQGSGRRRKKIGIVQPRPTVGSSGNASNNSHATSSSSNPCQSQIPSSASPIRTELSKGGAFSEAPPATPANSARTGKVLVPSTPSPFRSRASEGDEGDAWDGADELPISTWTPGPSGLEARGAHGLEEDLDVFMN